ncbi:MULTISPECIES: ferredoxin--NADP reductase [unclassified Streptomyces]|uniref:ferredoxin--NADP reductase n=1 Tax=unclassified Streptomyces TaxID=2593676 RepID=UPI00278C76BC|nr:MULTISPECIES: ferredoxin--NADP reductase [unclassified Streptomyces]
MSSADLAEPATGVLTLRVADVVRETADAVSLVLDAPELPYLPGQFLTLRIPGGGARCYSLASSPYTGEAPRVTVKKVPGGAGSGWVCEQVAAGDVLECLPPAGTFTPASLDEDVLLVAGGSGITPCLSIARSVLAAGTGTVTLVYANRDQDSVIFRDALRGLAAEYPDRFAVVHWLETLQGLPTRDALAALLRPLAAARTAYLCGPQPLMDGAEDILRAAGAAAVHRERYFSLSGDVFDAPAPVGSTVTVTAELYGQTHEAAGDESTPLLDALLAAGVPAPYSCREGACAACTCRVVEGEVTLRHNEVLDAEDLAEGYTLACQAVPVTDRIRVEY